MEKYRVEFRKTAQREIERLPKKDILAILKAIGTLSENPRGQNSIKLTGEEKYRLRVGRYRILYEIHDDVLLILVVKVAHRKEAYRWASHLL